MAPAAKSGMATRSTFSPGYGMSKYSAKNRRAKAPISSANPAEMLLARGAHDPERHPVDVHRLGRLERARPRGPPGRWTSSWSGRSGRVACPRRARSRSTGEFEMASRSGSTIRATSKTALRSGSSKHGKHRRASTDSNCVVAMVCSLAAGVGVGGAVEATQFVVEGPGESAGHRVGPGASGPSVPKTTCSSSSSKVTVQAVVVPSAAHLDVGDGQLGGVEDDGVHRFVDDHARCRRCPRRWRMPRRARSRSGTSRARPSGAGGTPRSPERQQAPGQVASGEGYPRHRG